MNTQSSLMLTVFTIPIVTAPQTIRPSPIEVTVTLNLIIVIFTLMLMIMTFISYKLYCEREKNVKLTLAYNKEMSQRKIADSE